MNVSPSVVEELAFPRHASLPPNTNHSVLFRSFAVSPTRYLVHLQQRVEGLGGHIHRACLPTDGGLPKAIRAARELIGWNKGSSHLLAAVVNATGLGARTLLGDEALYPIRGQTVLVKGVAKRLTTWTGSEPGVDVYNDVVIMPRPVDGHTVIGVSREKGVDSMNIDEHMTQRLLAAGRKLAPELLTGAQSENYGFEVIETRVGLRPGRKGGPRVEIEEMKPGDSEPVLLVVHEYGHAGAG